MRGCILAFAIGVALLQQQSELPDTSWSWALLPLAASVFLLFRSQANRLPLMFRALLVIFFLFAGFFWAAVSAERRLADVLPYAWEGRDIQLVGVVAELPQANESGVRFAFDVE